MRLTHQGLILSIKVTPLASKNEVLLSKEGAFHIKTVSAPERNKACLSVIELLATFLKVPKSCLDILQGKTSRQKKS